MIREGQGDGVTARVAGPFLFDCHLMGGFCDGLISDKSTANFNWLSESLSFDGHLTGLLA